MRESSSEQMPPAWPWSITERRTWHPCGFDDDPARLHCAAIEASNPEPQCQKYYNSQVTC